LLKEAYGDQRDLCEEFRSWGGPQYNIWWNASYYALAVQVASNRHLPAFPGSEIAAEAFLSSAVINIKKSGGKSKSDSDELLRYARRDRALLLEQVRLIRPDVVVSGNVWNCIEHLWPGVEQIYDLAWSADGMLFLDLWHPAARFSHQLNYYAIAALVRGARRHYKS
jgi:hypothetical protein